MNKEALHSRVEAFLKEFAFVCRYVKTDKFRERPTVQRIDLDLLDRYGCTYEHARGPGYQGYTRFFLIGTNGQELSEVKPYDVVKPKFSLWHRHTWFHQDVAGETVYEAIQRLGYSLNRVMYVLEVNDHWGQKVILHKVPSGRSLSDWLAQIREVAESELRDELVKVNRV